jgi:putative flavoprotein involved in K+ transport
MTSTDTVVVGAGHAGLAVSRLLTETARDHVVLERGRVAERWHSQRWDSLRLLTPNWMTRLPGWSYSGGDPDGFQTAAEFATSLRSYAHGFDAPVLARTAVGAIRPRGDGYAVTTTSGIWRARNVVLATGYCDIARIPPALDRLDPDVRVVGSADYRNPAQLPPGGVLVVGASASGVQIADELARSGRRVVLAVGAHTRVPRRYRGRDVMGWLDRLGLLDRPADEVADLDRARREPSLQLVGRPGGGTLDLGSLQRSGVLLAGRLAGAAGRTVRFADDLARTTADADERLRRLLARIDAHIDTSGLAAELPPGEPLPPVRPAPGPAELDLAAADISSVVTATGYRRAYPWLQVPVLDAAGEIRQRGGRTPVPGLYVVGMRFQTRRNSTFIGGARHDAALVVDAIAARGGATATSTLRRAG